MKLVVGPSEMQTVNTSGNILETSSIGTGVGIIAHDPYAKVGGILYFLLPSSRISQSKAQKNIFMFADSGIPVFLDALFQLGATKQHLNLVTVGGSQILDQKKPFDIGQRNCLAAKTILSKNDIAISHKDFGGNFFRIARLKGEHIYIVIPGHGEKMI